MQNNLRHYTKWVLFIALIVAQTSLFAQTQNALSISVAGIDFSDPNFALLKESVEKNKKVTAVKQYYDASTGRLNFQYKGTAQELWSEIPATTKNFFKITGLDDTHIVLSLTGTNNNIKTPATSSTREDDCKNCYWKICNYDQTISFQGKIYKGINYDEGTYYFNCDDGVLVRKIIYKNGYGQTTSIQTDTLLMSSGPVGTQWGVVNISSDNKLLGVFTGGDASSSNSSAYTLIAKNIATEAGGKKYDNVIVVNFRGVAKDFMGTNLYSINSYYAKGIGLIRTDTLNFHSDPVAAINKNTDTKSVYSSSGTIKNGVDESIIGIWKFHDAKTGKDNYYRFNNDGTFDYYAGAMTDANRLQGTNHWKLEGIGYDKNGVAVIDMTWGTSPSTLRYEFSKKNDTATGKAAIDIQGALMVTTGDKKW